jgi:dnd system-associated protein 4
MANIRIKKKYATLVDDCVGAVAPFKSMAQLACFASMYAFNQSVKITSVKATGGQEIRDAVLDDIEFKNQIGLLAIAHTKNPEILLDDEETKEKRFKIFEDYTNAGLELIKDKKDKDVLDTNGLDTILSILKDQTKSNLKLGEMTGKIEKPIF